MDQLFPLLPDLNECFFKRLDIRFSLIVLSLFLTHRAVESSRQS